MQNYKQDFFGRGGFYFLCGLLLAGKPNQKYLSFPGNLVSPPCAQETEASHFLDSLLALNPTGHAIPFGSPLYVTINWQPFPPITLRKRN